MRAGLVVLCATAALAAASTVRGAAQPCAWTPAAAPPALRDSVLSISARSPYDVWAIGRGYAAHWNGASWTPTPVQGRDVSLQDVWVASNADAWVVGGLGHDALVERWDGRRWARVALGEAARPRLAPGSYRRLYAVSGRDAADVWAVGADEHDVRYGAQWRGVVLHYDGRRWREVRLPGNVANDQDFRDVLVTTRGTVWVAGGSSFAVQTAAMALRYDGSHWQRFWLRGPTGTNGLYLHALAQAGNDVVAVGTADTGPGHLTGVSWGFLFRWNGRRWWGRIPDYGESYATYDAVAARSSREVWIASNDSDPFAQQAGAELFTGLDPNTRTSLPGGWIVTGMAFDGVDAWAVGGIGSGYAHPELDYDYARFQPFVMRYRCG